MLIELSQGKYFRLGVHRKWSQFFQTLRQVSSLRQLKLSHFLPSLQEAPLSVSVKLGRVFRPLTLPVKTLMAPNSRTRYVSGTSLAGLPYGMTFERLWPDSSLSPPPSLTISLAHQKRTQCPQWITGCHGLDWVLDQLWPLLLDSTFAKVLIIPIF